MAFDRRILAPSMLPAVLLYALASAGPAQAQSVMEQCIQRGFKPGTSGFYRCLQDVSGGSGGQGQKDANGDAGSILGGDPQDAVSDFTGSSMDGATAPDPNVLKNFNPGSGPTR